MTSRTLVFSPEGRSGGVRGDFGAGGAIGLAWSSFRPPYSFASAVFGLLGDADVLAVQGVDTDQALELAEVEAENYGHRGLARYGRGGGRPYFKVI